MKTKNTHAILKKLGIPELNMMQEEAFLAIQNSKHVKILSPTGTGKTLAFLLPILERLDPELQEIQLVIIVPTRELAIQIEQVLRDMGSGYKVNAFYGGQQMSKDMRALQHIPQILIGTPGRVADHIDREHFTLKHLNTLVLDEFDKSLEIGFEDDMRFILEEMEWVQNRVLTSATEGIEIPKWVMLKKEAVVDYLHEKKDSLKLMAIHSPEKDKLNTLVEALCNLRDQSGIIFLNFKDAINRVSDHLELKGIDHGCFYGGLDQHDRERSIIKFSNGSHRILIATDLAARGLDINELDYIIHYHLPLREEEFTHRNGRTARMHSEGVAYVLHWVDEVLPDYMPDLEPLALDSAPLPKPTPWLTVLISGGRKDKISKGDIAGWLMKKGGLGKDEVGQIDLKADCAFVAIAKKKAPKVIDLLNNTRLKSRKVRIYEV